MWYDVGMQTITDKTFDEERALYGSNGVEAVRCRFDGPADGESAFKESRDITARECYFNLRYPFWHVDGLRIDGCEMTSLCRAAIWYSSGIAITNTRMHGIKALRECAGVEITGCDIVSPFMTMALIPLACLPELRLTDRGLVDCTKFCFSTLEVEE